MSRMTCSIICMAQSRVIHVLDMTPLMCYVLFSHIKSDSITCAT